jgi:hypothetical protein
LPELERQLRTLGGEIAFPPTPDLVTGVADRLRAGTAPPRWLGFRLRPAAIALAALVLALTAALAVPPARSALLDLLGIGGATIERVPTQPVAPEDADLALGERIPSEDAARAVDFRVLVPRAAGLRAYVDRSVPRTKVSFVWSAAGNRLLLSEFRGQVFVEKEAGPETRIVETTVRGVRAVWVVGAPHVVIWRDANGHVREETRRLAGNVLLWEERGVTYRLEGARDRAHALRVARSFR